MTILKLIKYANMMIKKSRINAKRKNNKKQIKNKKPVSIMQKYLKKFKKNMENLINI